ncbi:F11 receptor, tandem duplicate 1 [Nelusetta ayraudi]|uniref:F11 receptor, tandem duplicate 1 n=1 Tax=Nelusetta ayraudi TaxID=303726 RepID=UPI003F728AC1
MTFYWLVSAALFLLAATGVTAFTVTSNNPDVRVKENEGVDLTCTYSADFGGEARVEWKFQDLKGSQTYVFYRGELTDPYANRVVMYNHNVRLNKVTRKDNGMYDCEVSGNNKFGEARVKLTVLVPPSPPHCKIPSSMRTGHAVKLTCEDGDGSPPPTYSWYKDGVLLPVKPSTVSGFQNSTYKLDPTTGVLDFPKVAKTDSGQYVCEVSNDQGSPQRCRGTRMEVRDLNTGGIVAGVIVVLLLLALLGFGLFYAHKKGYLAKKNESKPKTNVVYQPPSLYGGEDDDGDFRQKSSFVV